MNILESRILSTTRFANIISSISDRVSMSCDMYIKVYIVKSSLAEVVPTADPAVAFKDVSAAFLVGAMPRREGMERKDLLAANVEIFKVQGEALDKYARKDVKVLVVGNPANTNALICSHYAPSIPKQNFTAMTRLDQNRAQAALAARLGVQVTLNVTPYTLR